MRLNEFIKKNADEFNNEEPLNGHFERFEQRLLKNKQKHKKPSSIWWLAGVAAAMILLLILLPRNSEKDVKCIMSAEMKETQNYYVSVLQSETETVEKLLENIDANTKQEVMKDVKIIITESEEFSTTFCNSSDAGTAIMVEYYQAKIQALQNIITIFERYN